MKTNKILMSAFALTVAFASLTSCGGDDPVAPLPQIGGYDNAGQVGKTDLVAYWSMDGNGKESISGTLPATTVGTTWTTGVKGQGANLTAGYMDFPSIPALSTSSGSITVSLWAKLSNTKATPDGLSHISEIFNISGSTPGNGYIGVLGETHGLVSSDTIQVKGHYETKYNGAQSSGDIVNMTKMESWMIADNANPANVIKHVAFANKIGGQWAHIVYVFNGSTAKNEIYVNGTNVSNSPWVLRNGGVTPFPLAYDSTTHPVIGARSNFIAGLATGDTWNRAMTGGVDEIRVYNKALSGGDINSLYELEKAGR
jgi:hypothetical protein